MPIISRSCFGKVSEKPLIEYVSESDALDGAEYTHRKYGSRMVPYRCATCDWWHLSPTNRQTPNSTCVCTGRDGRPKASYASDEDAERRAEILQEERGVKLGVYRCNQGGWHLTKG